MSNSMLDSLATDQYLLQIGFCTNPRVVVRKILQTDEYRQVVDAIRTAAITSSDIKHWVNQQDFTTDLKLGFRHSADIPLAVLAVALATLTSKFSEEYLKELSLLRQMEVRTAIDVARFLTEYRHEEDKRYSYFY